MADLVFIATLFAFIGLCVLYVRGLDRIVRSGEQQESGEVER
jgi:hypothetical protein